MRGIHKASKDVQNAMRIAKKNWNEYYILKMDVTTYFQNIDKQILWEILKRKIKDKKLLWLTRTILLSTKGMKGLPLGNYTSQMFANIYLNEIDQYVKHQKMIQDKIKAITEKQEGSKNDEEMDKTIKEFLKLEKPSKRILYELKFS